MKRTVILFLLVVLLPAMVLGYLALRSAEEQSVLVERQTAALYQKVANDAAAAVRERAGALPLQFAEQVRAILRDKDSSLMARMFSEELKVRWPMAEMGFVVTDDGTILSPTPGQVMTNEDWPVLVAENELFLNGKVELPVYNAPFLNKEDEKSGNESKAGEGGQFSTVSRSIQKLIGRGTTTEEVEDKKGEEKQVTDDREKNERAEVSSAPLPSVLFSSREAPATEVPLEGGALPKEQLLEKSEYQEERYREKQTETRYSAERDQMNVRQVMPQQVVDLKDWYGQQLEQQAEPRPALATVRSLERSFLTLVREQPEGMLARFANDALQNVVWLRGEEMPTLVFGAILDPNELAVYWTESMRGLEFDGRAVVVALLNEKGKVVWKSDGGYETDWRVPFVAAEVGEVLPYWEAAVYLKDASYLARTASYARYTVWGMIVVALGAMGIGTMLLIWDTHRQLELARKKTDFVSNVSHELKTPLTSIRMFAELLAGERQFDEEKRQQYLQIITLEAERLTRLINNVLDFAKMERGKKNYDKKPLDFYGLIERVWIGQKMHLEQNGFEVHWKAEQPPYPVIGDEDALAQVLVNLLSNAEKYSGESKVVEIHSWLERDELRVSVLDRGLGVPKGEEKKIFERFYRAHDSLGDGIQGSGLGLTLAQKIMEDHGGELFHAHRAGGGSSFTLRMPLRKER